MTVHFGPKDRPLSSTLAKMTVQFGSRPSTFGQTVHFRATFTLRTVYFRPYGPSTLDQTRLTILKFLTYILIVFCENQLWFPRWSTAGILLCPRCAREHNMLMKYLSSRTFQDMRTWVIENNCKLFHVLVRSVLFENLVPRSYPHYTLF